MYTRSDSPAMTHDKKTRAHVPELLQQLGQPSAAGVDAVARHTGVPAADVFGVESFYSLLDQRDLKTRVCTGLSCRLAGAEDLLKACDKARLETAPTSCIAACDRPPAMLRERRVVCEVTTGDVLESQGSFEKLYSAAGSDWRGSIWPATADEGESLLNLAAAPNWSAAGYAKALEIGPEAVIQALEEAGLQGRGGAGFPAHIKWSAVRGEAEPVKYIVLNGDEAEPGTFKDREIMLRRPDLVLDGLAIAAHAVGAGEVWLYLRGEFEIPLEIMERAVAAAEEEERYGDLAFHFHSGHGAYICGEETALLESLEGRRGMPRHKPPFPTAQGLWGKPTLIHNVETIALVPTILLRGAEFFRQAGKTQPGTKLYCLSGHVARPGVYEMPLGVSLDELVEAAGGYIGELKAFSPGGASSGFLPASERARPLDFQALAEVDSMLGSAGVVVLNEGVNMAWAAAEQLEFFERESCGQCAPCRIGTAYQRASLERFREDGDAQALEHVDNIAWEMIEGSICGLGQTASLPLTSALRHFPEDFVANSSGGAPR
jgi:NADH:ubiquinone oxidoreductase subunit F (NADH-binding)